MPDMLVRLYDLELDDKPIEDFKQKGVIIRRPIAPEKAKVVEWVSEHFGRGWASECDASFAVSPAKCIVAQKDGKILGFACFDSTYKAFFGPTGVDENERGNGYGKALLSESLRGLRDMGYAYGIIGSAGPVDFYKKVCGATVIENSTPGIYKDMLY